MGKPITDVNSHSSGRWNLEWLVVAGLGAILLVSPVFFGSAAVWARGVLLIAGSVVLGIWLLGGVLSGNLFLARTGLWVLGLALVGLVVFQLIPLDRSTLSRLSPATVELYERALPQAHLEHT